VAGNAAFSGNECATSRETATDGGSDSWGLTELGSYSGDSFSYSSVVYWENGSNSGSLLDTGADTFSQGTSVNARDTSQLTDGNAIGTDDTGDQGSATDSGSLSENESDQASGSDTVNLSSSPKSWPRNNEK
jgi:hypothetical protein